MMDGVDSVSADRSARKWRIAFFTCIALVLLGVGSVYFPALAIAFIAAPVALLGWIFWSLWKGGLRGRIFAAIIVAAVGTISVTVALRSRTENARVEALRSSLESALGTSLVVGDTYEKIERVLKERGLHFTYSDVLRSYYASVPTGMPDRRIDITIAVDGEKRFQTSSVRVFHTSS